MWDVLLPLLLPRMHGVMHRLVRPPPRIKIRLCEVLRDPIDGFPEEIIQRRMTIRDILHREPVFPFLLSPRDDILERGEPLDDHVLVVLLVLLLSDHIRCIRLQGGLPILFLSLKLDGVESEIRPDQVEHPSISDARELFLEISFPRARRRASADVDVHAGEPTLDELRDVVVLRVRLGGVFMRRVKLPDGRVE